MKRKYSNQFHYIGFTELSHIEENGDEIWVTPTWESKLCTGKRAKFLHQAILKELPMVDAYYDNPAFNNKSKYTLTIECKRSGNNILYINRIGGGVIPPIRRAKRGKRRVRN